MASLSSSPTAPWTADQLTAARTAGTPHSWAISARRDGVIQPAPAWGVSFTLDETSTPFGVMKFSTTPETAAALGFSPLVSLWDPIFLDAGYSTRSRVFWGRPISRRRLGVGSSRRVEVSVTTGEDLWDPNPFAADYSVPDSFSTLPQVITDICAGGTAGYIGSSWPMNPFSAALDAPTSGQLAAFRALDFAAGDSIGDGLRSCASALGQKIRGDQVSGDPWAKPAVRITPQYVYAAGSALTIQPGEYFDYDRDESADDYASLLRLTAQWTSGGDLKSSTYVYDSGANFGNQKRVATKDILVQLRPELSGGVRKLTASNPIGLAYAATYARRTWLTTVTMRAWWWLEPGMSLTITGPEGQVDNGIVSRVSFDVDHGLMTVTIRPS